MTNRKCLYGLHVPANAVSDNPGISVPCITMDFERANWDDSFLLTTCERFDAYIYSEDHAGIMGWLYDLFPGSTADIKKGDAAVQYLFETASGIHSLNLGESEILHQVKKCLNQQLRSSKEAVITKRLLQKALETGKLVRTKTGIGNTSLSYAGSVYNILQEYGNSRFIEVAIIGGGTLGRSILKILLKKNKFKPTLISRCEANRKKITKTFGIDVLSPEQFKTSASKFDAVVGAASTTEPMMEICNFDPDTLVIDLGMPPIFETPGNDKVRYVNLSDLQEVFKKHRAFRKKHLPRARSIVRIKVNEFSNWLEQQQISPIIQYLSGNSDRWRTLSLMEP